MAEALTEPARVVLVDDHAIVRQGLRAALALEGDIEVVGEASNREAALGTIARQRPDLAVIDLKLSAEHPAEGLDLCSEIVQRYPDVGVIVLTTFLNQQLVLDAIRRGAKGYVLKDVDVVELARIIRAVRRGEPGFDTRSTALMARSLVDRATGQPRPELSERELEIVRLIAQGLANREIAGRIFISESTVKYHIRNVMQKLNVNHRAEIVYAATKLGLL
jgi:two-component system, NarL family, response regulator DevR